MTPAYMVLEGTVRESATTVGITVPDAYFNYIPKYFRSWS
jgi:hypothetical protein